MPSNHVRIFDTTLRDGEQSPGYAMQLSEKLQMARQLDRLGVDIIEAGFPIASPDDFKAVQEVANFCENATVCGLARALEKDIRCAGEAISQGKKTRIHTFVSTSEIHMKHQIRKTKEEVLQMAEDAVKLAASLCDDVEFSPMDATRSEPEFLYQVLKVAVAAGATTLNIPDTVGYATPSEYGHLIADIIANIDAPDVTISTHCHDDLGLAVANSLAGVQNGARQVECTINGIGERAGNASLEEVVMALRTRQDFYELETGIVTTEIYPTSRVLTSITGVPVQPNKAIVGANAFAHESGIHQDGILKERTTYEIMSAEDVGMASNRIVLGKHSGRAALNDRLESLGYTVSKEQLQEVYDRFIALAEKKKEVFDADLIVLMDQVIDQIHEFTLENLEASLSTNNTPQATVTLISPDGKTHTHTSEGDGPVDAACSAINAIMGIETTLLDYTVRTVTEGSDAQANVAVKIQAFNHVFGGHSSGTDVVIASAQGYLQALNRAYLYHKDT